MPIQWRELYTSKSSKFLSNLTRNWQFLQKIIFFFIFDFLAKIFGPSRQLSTPGRFDFMKFFVPQMWEKNVSWFQLFVYIFQKKKLNVFRFCYHWDNFITNSWLWWIFKFTKFSSKIFGGVAQNFLDENFVNLKIHHNQLFIMKLSQC